MDRPFSLYRGIVPTKGKQKKNKIILNLINVIYI